MLAPDDDVLDLALEFGEQTNEVAVELSLDLLVRECELLVSATSTGEADEGATGFAGAAVTHGSGVVEHHLKAEFGCRDGVVVVPALLALLGGEHADDDVAPVLDGT